MCVFKMLLIFQENPVESVFHSPSMRQHVFTLNLAQVSRADTHIYATFMFSLHTSTHNPSFILEDKLSLRKVFLF